MKKNNKKKKNIDYQARRERIENAKTVGKTLFSNDACVSAGKHFPWWSALIVFVLAIFLPIIPMLTQGMTSAGSDMIARKTYGFDTRGAALVQNMAENEIGLTVDNGKLRDINDTWKNAYAKGEANSLLQYADRNMNEESRQYELMAYYTTYSGKEFETFRDKVLSIKYLKGSNVVYNPEIHKDKNVKTYTPNTIIIMNHDVFQIMFYDVNSKYIAGMAGDYLNLPNGFKISDLAKVEGMEADITNKLYCDKVLDNWKGFLDKAYLHTRNFSTMVSTLTAAGVYVGLGIFMGLMIFLLTRGKRNINRILTFLQCQKIQAWAMFTPGLLGLIMGYIIPNGAIMFFIIFLGIRIMWMSMKQLRPAIR